MALVRKMVKKTAAGKAINMRNEAVKKAVRSLKKKDKKKAEEAMKDEIKPTGPMTAKKESEVGTSLLKKKKG